MPGTKTSKGYETVDQTVRRAQDMLSSSSLSTQPSINLTPPKPGTQAPGMLGEIASASDAFVDDLKTQREEAQKGLEGSRDSLGELMGSLRGEVGLTAEAYETGGVNVAEKELNKINQQIRNEQRALQNRVRSIEERGGGLQGGVEAEIGNIERESLRKQADLYVIQQGVRGNYDSAKAIADRAVSAYLENQKIRLDATKFNYEENKDLFTKAEQREFEVNFDARKRALDREEVDLKSISDLSLDALQNGAPTELASQMRQAKTVAEAMEIGGQYIGLLERQKAFQSMANADLDRRMKLIELAKAGDTNAMVELGLDPSAPDVETKVQAQAQITRLDEEIARVQQMLDNDEGLQVSSGVVRSPFLSSFGTVVPATTLSGAGMGSLIPGAGTLIGGGVGLATGLVASGFEYAQQRDRQADFLAKANYVLTNLTTEKVKQLKAEGVAFTPMTDKDIELIGRSVGEIAGYAIKDESGKIVGFTSEDGVRRALAQVQETLEKSKTNEYQKMISSSERKEIDEQ